MDPQSPNLIALLADDAFPAVALIVGSLVTWLLTSKSNKAKEKVDSTGSAIAALQAALERLTTELGELRTKVEELESEVEGLDRAHRSAIRYVQRLIGVLRGAGIAVPQPPESVREHLDETDLDAPAGSA